MRVFFVILLFVFTGLHFYQPDMDSYSYVIRNFAYISTIALLFFTTFNLMRKNTDNSQISWKHFAILSTLAIYQPLHFYVTNITEIRVSYFLIATAIIYLYFFILYLILNVVIKNKYNSLFTAIIFTNLSIIIFSNFDINIFITLLILYLLSQIQIKKILPPIMIFSSVLLLLNAYLYISNTVKIISTKQKPIVSQDIQNILTDKKPRNRDIYIILLDMYSGSDVLKQKYNYDNSEFIKKLKKEGFYVFDKMYSNYDSTYLSLPSMINIEYFEELNQEPSSASIETAKLYKIAKLQGYKTVFMRNEAIKPKPSEYLDIVVSDGEINRLYEMLQMFLGTSIYNNFIKSKSLMNFLNKTYADKVNQAINIKGKKLSFWHMFMPHPPFLYDENKNNLNTSSFDEGYIPYLKYTNKWTLETIKKLKHNKKKLPVIIITGDHGMKQSDINSYFSTFTAYYNPEQEYTHIKSSKTLINFFINFVNYEFSTNIPVKKDKIICTISNCGAKYSDVARNEYVILKFFNTSKNITEQLLK